MRPLGLAVDAVVKHEQWLRSEAQLLHDIATLKRALAGLSSEHGTEEHDNASAIGQRLLTDATVSAAIPGTHLSSTSRTRPLPRDTAAPFQCSQQPLVPSQCPQQPLVPSRSLQQPVAASVSGRNTAAQFSPLAQQPLSFQQQQQQQQQQHREQERQQQPHQLEQQASTRWFCPRTSVLWSISPPTAVQRASGLSQHSETDFFCLVFT